MRHTASIILLAGAVAILCAAKKNDSVMTKEGSTYIVNTTTIANDVEGYNGPTPLKVYIKKGKVLKIEALPNKETPKYWNAATKHLLEKWNGKKIADAKEMQVDGRTGATFSSNAIKENVARALDYYQKNK